MDKSDKFTFRTLLALVFVIIVASLIIFILTPSPISPSRRYFGYIYSISTLNSTTTLQFDKAEWVTEVKDKSSGNLACINKDDCKSGSSISRDDLIVNTDKSVVKYTVTPFTKVGTLIVNPDWDEKNPNSKPYKTITIKEFEDIIHNPESPDNWIADVPYDITVLNNWVTVISQHYIP